MSEGLKPAWSSAFDDGILEATTPLPLSEPITKDWAWGGSAGSGVKVAVIDSGVDARHPAVRTVAGYAALTWNEDDEVVEIDESPHEDLYGHGTACAGIIRSLAPEAEIYSVRVLGSDLRGKSLIFGEGIRWAIDSGMDVINMSLSTGNRDYFDMFHELADHAYFHNTMLVCAANNVDGPSYPSTYASVISVAAHAGKDPLSFAYNPTPPVEFGAPGIDLEIPWLDGSTIEATGNSFAAPHIAGIVALIRGKHARATPFQVKTILQALAVNTRG